MRPVTIASSRILAGISLLAIFGGCASHRITFSLPAYQANANRSYQVASQRTVIVSPLFDRLPAEAHDGFDPTFSPSGYLTNAVEAELAAAGIAHDRVGFAFAPSFEGLQQALQGGALNHEESVVLAGAVTHFPDDRVVSCDFKVYSAHGALLFEKRCLCMGFAFGGGSAYAPHMVMQQLFADPNFQKAIQ
jgi:hypothetical protein